MNKGMKNDFKDDKLRWDLLPLKEIEDIVKVYTEGAKNIQIIHGSYLIMAMIDIKLHCLGI